MTEETSPEPPPAPVTPPPRRRATSAEPSGSSGSSESAAAPGRRPVWLVITAALLLLGVVPQFFAVISPYLPAVTAGANSPSGSAQQAVSLQRSATLQLTIFTERTGLPGFLLSAIVTAIAAVLAVGLWWLWQGREVGRKVILAALGVGLIPTTFFNPVPNLPYAACFLTGLIGPLMYAWLLYRPSVTEYLTGRPAAPSPSLRETGPGGFALTVASLFAALAILCVAIGRGFGQTAAEPPDLTIPVAIFGVLTAAAALVGLRLLASRLRLRAAGYLLIAIGVHVLIAGATLLALSRGWLLGMDPQVDAILRDSRTSLPIDDAVVFWASGACFAVGGLLHWLAGRHTDVASPITHRA